MFCGLCFEVHKMCFMSVLLGIFLFVFSPQSQIPKFFTPKIINASVRFWSPYNDSVGFLKEYEFDVIFGKLLWRIFNSVIRILVKKHEKKKKISSNQIAYDCTNLFALRIVEFYHNFVCTSLYMLRIKYTEHWLSYIFLETRREKKYILPQTILKQIKKS